MIQNFGWKTSRKETTSRLWYWIRARDINGRNIYIGIVKVLHFYVMMPENLHYFSLYDFKWKITCLLSCL